MNWNKQSPLGRVVLAACLTVATAFALTALNPAPAVHAAGGSGCELDVKFDNSGGTFNAPEGTSISGICIKAGRGVFEFLPGDKGDGCYTLAWTEVDGCWTAVTVGGGGTGRDCKSISHWAVGLEAGDCKPPSKEDCKNGVDDDGDGLIDCQDGDCADVCK